MGSGRTGATTREGGQEEEGRAALIVGAEGGEGDADARDKREEKASQRSGRAERARD